MSQEVFSPERRRTVRIKRSGLLKWQLDEIDRPAIKIADAIDEYEQAFCLVHDTYLKMGYLSAPKPHGMLFGIHTLLPETALFVAKSYLTVISTLTEIFDTDLFGLPMDTLYRRELDALRAKGRKIVELSALVTPVNLRWMNLFMYVNRVMYQYSLDCGVDDICIAVNPKHVKFYKNILLFEDLGPERHYPRVNAPAVALRINMDDITEKSKSLYNDLDFECNVHEYFHRGIGRLPSAKSSVILPEAGCPEADCKCWTLENFKYFLTVEKSILDELSQTQKDYLISSYPGLTI